MIYDSRKASPFPLKTKHLLLDWDSVPSQEKEELVQLICAHDRRVRAPAPSGMTEKVITQGWSYMTGPHPRLLHFRQYFREASVEVVDKELHDPNAETIDWRTLSFATEYVEDETGRGMTNQEMMNRAAGGTVLIMNDPRSVLLVGPGRLKEASKWAVRDSNLMQQFLRVVERLRESAWFRNPPQISYLHSEGAQQSVVQKVFPAPAEVAGVMAWVRQIYSSDDLFAHAVNLYLRYIDNDGKHTWVSWVRKQFNELRTQPPALTPVNGYGRRELIDLFAYGARILHRQSDGDSEAALAKLCADHGDAEVAMAIDSSMRELVHEACLAYYPLKQDFDHWISTGAIPKPDVKDLDDLLRSD
jgi:hypothetical protein